MPEPPALPDCIAAARAPAVSGRFCLALLLLALAVVMGKGHYRQQDVQLYADRFANMLRQAKAENFGVDGEDDLHRARKQAAGAPRVIRSSETVVERDDTPYWDIYRNTRN